MKSDLPITELPIEKEKKHHSWWHIFFTRDMLVADEDHTYFGGGSLRERHIEWCPICKRDVTEEF